MKCIVILNHSVLPEQKKELIERFGVDSMEHLPDFLSDFWAHIPADEEAEAQGLEQIKQFILNSTHTGDLVWVQGDFGATFAIVNTCLAHQRLPVYAYTQRSSKEIRTENGKVIKKTVFKHIKFKKYRR